MYTPSTDNKIYNNRDIQTIKEYIQTYGSDVVRWNLMDAHHTKSGENEEALEYTMELLQTFWNASRFIKTTFFADQE